ncbi:MAG TPA: DUF805 domain-containing protein [Allosphingosinicella sp.]
MIGRSLGYNLARLFNFSGRETRRLFWPYAITVFVLTIIIDMLLFVPVMMQMMQRMAAYVQAHPEGLPQPAAGQPPVLPPELFPDMRSVLMPMVAVSVAAMFLYAAAAVRRLHDCGRTAWWAALPVPFMAVGIALAPRAMDGVMHLDSAPSLWSTLGSLNSLVSWGIWILLIVFLASQSETGPNRFGEAPALS